MQPMFLAMQSHLFGWPPTQSTEKVGCFQGNVHDNVIREAMLLLLMFVRMLMFVVLFHDCSTRQRH
jgi:hypothetical protein